MSDKLNDVAQWIAGIGDVVEVTVKSASGVTSGLRMPKGEKPKPVKYQRVRIAVAIGPTGEWCVNGCSKGGDDKMRYQVRGEFLDGGLKGLAQVHFIEADVPIPAEQTINGSVEE